MISEDGTAVQCDHEGCEAEIPNHAWGRIKDGAGWFHGRTSNQDFCPQHLPIWIVEWRKHRKTMRKRGTW